MLNSLLSRWMWRKSKGWLHWEASVLESVAEQIIDLQFRSAFTAHIAGVYEVERHKDKTSVWSRPSFVGPDLLEDTKCYTLAKLSAKAAGKPVHISIEVGGGMIGCIRITGGVSSVGNLSLENITVLSLLIPHLKGSPVLTGWLKEIYEQGHLGNVSAPASQQLIHKARHEFPCLPLDYFEFCMQSDGATILPHTEDYVVLGLHDIESTQSQNGRQFILLVDMRELGGLGCFVAKTPQPIVSFEKPEGIPFVVTFQDALIKLIELNHTPNRTN